jgi:hypothetical protein
MVCYIIAELSPLISTIACYVVDELYLQLSVRFSQHMADNITWYIQKNVQYYWYMSLNFSELHLSLLPPVTWCSAMAHYIFKRKKRSIFFLDDQRLSKLLDCRIAEILEFTCLEFLQGVSTHPFFYSSVLLRL